MTYSDSLVRLKIAEAFPEGRARRRDAPRGHSLHGCRLVPGPKAWRNKLRAPRSGDFLCREPGLLRGGGKPLNTFTGDAADREVQNVR